MLGSIYIGLSGMDAYTQGLQTISNNIANLNSPGFKATTVNFSDMFAAGGDGLTFTSNGQPTGGGVHLAPPTTDFNQGTLRQTTSDLDLALQGSGFLVLQSGDKIAYARTGQFFVDNDGFITIQGTTYHLTVLDPSNQPAAPNLDAKRTSAPVATTKITFADNLSSTATTASVSSINVFDSSGGKHIWQVNFAAVGATAPGQWNVTVLDETGATVATSVLKFNGSAVDPATQTLTVNTTPTSGAPLSVVLDFSSRVTSFSGGTASTLRAASVDGNGVGDLASVTIDDSGQVKLTYSNNKTELLGAVAIADFRDPQQLKAIGDGLFENPRAAQHRLVASTVDGVGKLVSREIEASNVDLSQAFGDLILIQRGFQASSQVVSVSNDMIQELFGIRGRG
ncbi:MAG: hypothetical protein JWM33_2428 [Caulobacteraceae bacterium]|nr:hypothetical protein [Caulobacteraceae bacterium]